MDTAFETLRNFAKTADEAGRKKLLDGLRDLSYSIESSQDSIQRILFAVSLAAPTHRGARLIWKQMRLAGVRIGADLKLFNILVDAKTPLTIRDIRAKTGVNPAPVLLASLGDITETAQDTFEANNVTRALAIDGFQGGVYHYFDSIGPAIQALPDFLKENNYQDITDVCNTPLQKGQHTDQPAFIWVQTKPELFKHFNAYMAVQRLGMPTWLDFYPYQDRIHGLEPEQALFVDVGGGLGHQSVALREALPEVPNKITVQDLPMTLAHAVKHHGVELQEHDFWNPQPIKGARFYYMRNIIHDYPDEKAIELLKTTIAALGPNSTILIDDMVVPNKGARWETTQLDITMMSACASLERTHDQWYVLVAKAGLKIVNMYRYTISLQDHIIECVRA